jgi:hypothetical protein
MISVIVGLAGRAAADVADPAAQMLYNASGFLSKTYLGIWLAHTGFGLPFAIYLLAQLHRRPAARPDRIGASMAPTTSRSFRRSCCRSPSRRSPPSPSSSSSGCGTTCWWPSSSSAPSPDQTVLTYKLNALLGLARRQLGNPHGVGLHHHRGAAARVLLAATLFRPRPAGRIGQGRLTWPSLLFKKWRRPMPP